MQISLDLGDYFSALVFGLALLWPLVAGLVHLGAIESHLLRSPALRPSRKARFAAILALGLLEETDETPRAGA